MNRIFLLDRSGSMESCWTDTIGGYNSFVASQKSLGGTMSLILFDHEYETVYQNKPISDVENLTMETYQPRGSTALLDAMGRCIKESNVNNPTVIILTDGLENASRTYTNAHIKDLVDQKTKEGWTFVYLGANQDAFAEGGKLGIDPRCTANFDVTKTPQLFATLSAAVSRHATGESQTVEMN
jgi:uncharacterized protein YegL